MQSEERKRMKKLGTIAMVALLAGSVVGGYSALAQQETVQEINENVQDSTNFMKATGVIQEIEKEQDGIRLTIENKEAMITILRINDDSLLFNSGTTQQLQQADLKKGATVEAYYDKNKPMILIYPTTVTPEIVILQDEEAFGEVKIGQFDKDFLSLDGELKLNIGEDTPLFNQQGKAIEIKDLHDKELMVFYSITTRSLPPQTPPTKIIALDMAAEVISEVQEIIASDHYMKDGVKMIPLRKVAEHLGYHVQHEPKINGAIVTFQNSSITITRGDKMYGYNKSLAKFEVAPELKDMKTYVSEDVLALLIQNK